ncbi:MAG: DUF4097 family beta strand repeat-containing protein [Gemmatimonadota bacterium]
MKRGLVFLIAFCGLLTNAAFAQRKLNERRAVVPSGFVRVFMLSGSVTVIGWDKDSLLVTGIVYEAPGDRFAVGVTPKGAKLGMWSEFETGLKPSHIVVRAPHRSQVWVKTTSADIDVRGLSGAVDLFSVSGSVSVRGAPREIYAETMGGGIRIAANTAVARLKTAGGALQVAGSITDLTAVTVSGAIDVARTQYRQARIESVDGDIRYAGAIPGNSGLELINHAGAIELAMPRDVAADFALSLYSGELEDDFGVAAKFNNPKLKTRTLSFTLGEKSSARVTLRSFKGRVAVRKL